MHRSLRRLMGAVLMTPDNFCECSSIVACASACISTLPGCSRHKIRETP